MRAFLLSIVLSTSVLADEVETEVTAEDSLSTAKNSEQTSQENDKTSNSEQDFKPEQEISEDYPISLPSDI